MDGRAFLDLARELLLGKTEAHWRGAAGRAYYALLLECREALRRWGIALPSGHGIHAFVRLRFSYAADADLKVIGRTLDHLVRLRNFADYELPSSPSFKSSLRAQKAVTESATALALLDAIEADPAHRSAAIAALKAVGP